MSASDSGSARNKRNASVVKSAGSLHLRSAPDMAWEHATNRRYWGRRPLHGGHTMNRVVRCLIAAPAVLIALLLAAPAPAAPPADPLVPASGSLKGFSGGELLGEELRQLFELPTDQNPFNNAGESCFAAGTNNDVLILWTRPPDQAPAQCTVRPGTPVFLFAFQNECSNVEDPPFDGGETEAGQRECAETGLDEYAAGQRPPVPAIEEILVSIDGGEPTDIFSDRYRAGSPQMTANLPEDNIFGVDAQAMTFVAAAWVAMIPPLPPGTHTISVSVVPKEGDPFVTEAEVTVVAGRS
jgi:hypothetical protein